MPNCSIDWLLHLCSGFTQLVLPNHRNLIISTVQPYVEIIVVITLTALCKLVVTGEESKPSKATNTEDINHQLQHSLSADFRTGDNQPDNLLFV